MAEGSLVLSAGRTEGYQLIRYQILDDRMTDTW